MTHFPQAPFLSHHCRNQTFYLTICANSSTFGSRAVQHDENKPHIPIKAISQTDNDAYQNKAHFLSNSMNIKSLLHFQLDCIHDKGDCSYLICFLLLFRSLLQNFNQACNKSEGTDVRVDMLLFCVTFTHLHVGLRCLYVHFPQ